MKAAGIQTKRERNSIRTFICIEVPARIRERIGELQNELRTVGGQVSWVKPSNIHLTLKFLGDVALSRIPKVSESVRRSISEAKPFEIEVRGAGCFPSPRNPRVLWVGLTGVPDELKQLHAAIEAELSQAGFDRESKPFAPHLTIGRLRSPRNAARVADKLISIGFETERFRVSEVIVMRSDFNPAGSVYTPQAAIRFPPDKAGLRDDTRVKA